MAKYTLILIILFSLTKENLNIRCNINSNQVIAEQLATEKNFEFKEIYNYKKQFSENEKINYFKKTLKKFDNKRSFDTSFKKYSFPFIKKIKQPATNLVFYLFKNEYADAIYGNSSYPFFIDDTKKRVLYYCPGDSLAVAKTSFSQYRNVREKTTKTSFYYNQAKKLFEIK